MAVTHITKLCSDLDKRPERGIGNEEWLPVEGAASEKPDLYNMFGHRSLLHLSLTTRQGLAVRQIEL